MTDNEIAYSAAVRYARRHIQDCCYGRPCLEDCLRRLGASLPPCACAGGWRPPRWAKWLALAAALAVVLFAALRSNADVQCIWNGSTYECSGFGSRVEVIGGGDSGPVVVTNVWGVCTNCVFMTPEYCETTKGDIDEELSRVGGLFQELDYMCFELESMLSNRIDDISTFQRIGTLPDIPVSQSIPVFSNYVYTVDNTQTSLVRDQVKGNMSVTHWRYLGSYSNGIYDYSQHIYPTLESSHSQVQSVRSVAQEGDQRIVSLRDAVADRIICEQCEAGDGKDPPGGSGGGSGISTNGNWCTFDQGEAIKDLLRDLKTWAERQHSQLIAISNYVHSSYETLRSGLFSDYTAIPRGEDWQDLYLSGQPTAWGYDPTNIIQRIEVLLYGMSGISTNAPSLEDTTPDAYQTVDDVSDAAASIRTDADGTAATTLGAAVLDFFRAFTPRTKNYQGGEEIIAEVSIQVGNDTHYVPAMRLGESGFLVDTMASVKTCVNGLCSVLFWVGGAFAVFRFWTWFSSWCIKLSKWAVELCTSLFAS